MRTEDLISTVLRRLLEMGYFHALPAVTKASKTLGRSMSTAVFNFTRGALYIPHYWAVYRHDGRLNVPVFPKEGTYLVWFRNPKDDPRHRGIFPVRGSGVKKLTAEEFRYWLEKNREAKEAGTPPPMIVTRAVYKPTRPTDFFENGGGGGMAGFVDKANTLANPFVGKALLDGIPGIGTPIKETVRIRI